MRQGLVGTAVILLLLSTISATAVLAANSLEVYFSKYGTPGSVYDVFMDAAKDDATTCDLVTPNGTYALTEISGVFRPEQDFFDDHIGISFAELDTAIATDWTLTWDAGPTQTVVSISFGTVLESEFLLIPTITSPLDGAPIQDPNPPTIEWTYDPVDPCDAQVDQLQALVSDHAKWWDAVTLLFSDLLACGVTSWTPAEAIPEGEWFIMVLNGINTRNVPDGITVEEGAWPLENGTWLMLSSIGISHNEVPVPTESVNWGAIKAMYQ